MAELRALIVLLSRYGAAGLVNTLVGYATIEVLYRVLGAPPALANAAGFAVGTVTGFVLSRGFVFRSDLPRRETAPRYLLTAATGFALNQAVLALMLGLLGRGGLGHEIAQLCAMGRYTVFVFLACRLWVFGKAPTAVGPDLRRPHVGCALSVSGRPAPPRRYGRRGRRGGGTGSPARTGS